MPSRTNLFWYCFAGDAARSVDHLSDTEPRSIAKVVDPVMLLQVGQRQHMGLGKIQDVNIIANARAIGRVVVIAKYCDVL